MTKHHSIQKFVFKIDTNTLKKSAWNLEISFNEAQKNEQIIALADSTTLRFIDDINNIDVIQREEEVKSLRERLKLLKKEKNEYRYKYEISKIYKRLNEISFVRDYICLVANNKTDYRRAVKGFYVNGEKFVRLLGTTGGLKCSTVVFVSEKIHDKLLKRLENGRNPKEKFIPSKYNAYLSLACSSSISVSEPDGVIVVKDCITKFKADYIEISDDDIKDEPNLKYIYNNEVEYNANDGFGLILPSQAEKWSNELQLDYRFSGCCIRNAFLKGMLYCFDFHDFANKIAKKDTIIDIWGTKRNIKDASIIITESMLKLWSSYSSYEDYYENCIENGFTYSITKVTPKELDKKRNLNYQFIQSYDLSDDEIAELCEPTINNIKDVLSEDINKTILFLKGYVIGEKSLKHLDCDFIKALMIDNRMINDAFVQFKLKSMLRKKINDAKMGVLQVNGNFSLLSGDPYSLCQSIFGLEVTGLLKDNEYYSKYWLVQGINKVVGFRAPMSCHNNIRTLNLVENDEINYWFQYMSEVTILNSWDLTNQAFNGCDFDGDLIFTTNNRVLLKNTKELPVLMCTQKKGDKVLITNKNLIESDMKGFGDEIGSITNKITEMFDIKSNFSKDSKEYNELEYRIMCGQKFQQDSIDKIKGIECKPMPKYWYDIHKINKNDTFNMSILANKKPYFFIYNYENLKSEYNKFIKKSQEKCIMLFGKNINSLMEKPSTIEENDFIYWYNVLNPITDYPSTMNKISHYCEQAFVDCLKILNSKKATFDYTILKNDKFKYTPEIFNSVKKLCDEYRKKCEEQTIKDKTSFKKSNKTIRYYDNKLILTKSLKEELFTICNNQYELANIMLDLFYNDNKNKQFAWDISGEIFIENLLEKNNHQIKFLELSENGDVEYNGFNFTERIVNYES